MGTNSSYFFARVETSLVEASQLTNFGVFELSYETILSRASMSIEGISLLNSPVIAALVVFNSPSAEIMASSKVLSPGVM